MLQPFDLMESECAYSLILHESTRTVKRLVFTVSWQKGGFRENQREGQRDSEADKEAVIMAVTGL